MGKKKRKRVGGGGGDAGRAVVDNNASGTSGKPSGDDDSALGGILRDELDITVETLRFLADRPELFASRAFRELRATLHPLVMQQMRKYDPVDYAARASAALKGGKWHDAMQALAGQRACGAAPPKQGTVQRWVRAADAAPDATRMQLLHAILATQQQQQQQQQQQPADSGAGSNKHDPHAALASLMASSDSASVGAGTSASAVPHLTGSGGGGAAATASTRRQWFPASSDLPQGETCDGSAGLRDGAAEMAPRFAPSFSDAAAGEDKSDAEQQGEGWNVVALPLWTAPGNPGQGSGSDGRGCAESGLKVGADADDGAEIDAEIRVVYREAAAERRPPNHHELRLFGCAPAAVRFEDGGAGTAVARHDIPGVPGAFMLTGVLGRRECAQLVRMAESMGFSPDHPVDQPSPTGIDSCEWLVDDALQAAIFRRVAPSAPVVKGCSACGINARWRFFRYDAGARYRPHIDGSWVGAGLDADGKYVHDAHGDRRSRFTFLMYLNEGFEGGATTFYLPESDGGGKLEARGVRPRQGAVLCFPQGNTASLVHEGSTVSKGRKYVIRTDMLFWDTPRTTGDSNGNK